MKAKFYVVEIEQETADGKTLITAKHIHYEDHHALLEVIERAVSSYKTLKITIEGGQAGP